MELARSTYYDELGGQSIAEARLIERIKEICAEWPSYGYRRVTAELHATGCMVNHKKVMRLMREHGLTVRPRGVLWLRPTATMTGRSSLRAFQTITESRSVGVRRCDSGCGDSRSARTGVGRWHDRRGRHWLSLGDGRLGAR